MSIIWENDCKEIICSDGGQVRPCLLFIFKGFPCNFWLELRNFGRSSSLSFDGGWWFAFSGIQLVKPTTQVWSQIIFSDFMSSLCLFRAIQADFRVRSSSLLGSSLFCLTAFLPQVCTNSFENNALSGMEWHPACQTNFSTHHTQLSHFTPVLTL